MVFGRTRPKTSEAESTPVFGRAGGGGGEPSRPTASIAAAGPPSCITNAPVRASNIIRSCIGLSDVVAARVEGSPLSPDRDADLADAARAGDATDLRGEPRCGAGEALDLRLEGAGDESTRLPLRMVRICVGLVTAAAELRRDGEAAERRGDRDGGIAVGHLDGRARASR